MAVNESSGDAAIRAAAERAESTRGRNLPVWEDLPIPNDTANLREGPDLYDACLSLLVLEGVFSGSTPSQALWGPGTDIVRRTVMAKEVNGPKRLYGLVNNGDLAYAEERAMVGQPLQPHTSAYLRRVAG